MFQATVPIIRRNNCICVTLGTCYSVWMTGMQGGYQTVIHTYLLTPWCRVLLEKLTGLQLVKKFPAFHRTRRFITTLTSVRHLSLSWASLIQSIYPHPTSWRSILILSTHLRLGLPSGLFPSGFPSKTLYTPLSSPICATFFWILSPTQYWVRSSHPYRIKSTKCLINAVVSPDD